MRAVTRCFNLVFAFVLWATSHLVWGGDAPTNEVTQPSPPTASAPAAPASKGKKAAKPKKLKPLERIRVHVESRHDLAERSLLAQVGPSGTLKYSVERLPILNEVHVETAALIDEPGGFLVLLKFNSMGTKILESYSSAAAGRHFVLMTDVDGEARWIGAPLIRHRIGDGILEFAPSVPREIMERLVFGLNDAIRKKRKRWLED